MKNSIFIFIFCILLSICCTNKQLTKTEFLQKTFNTEQIDTLIFYNINELPTFCEVETNREININNILNENINLQKEYYLAIDIYKLNEYKYIKIGKTILSEEDVDLMYKNNKIVSNYDTENLDYEQNFISKEKFFKLYNMLKNICEIN